MFFSESHTEETSAPGTESQENLKLLCSIPVQDLVVPPGAFQ